MTTELGSVAPGLRRSARQNLGLNGRDVQLDKLGQVLTAPSHQAQKRFAPTDGLYLPDNALAPVQKKARRGKKPSLPPPAASQPRHQLLPVIDPRLGFTAPNPPPTPSPPVPPGETLDQLSPLSPHITHQSFPPPPIRSPSVHPPPAYPPPVHPLPIHPSPVGPPSIHPSSVHPRSAYLPPIHLSSAYPPSFHPPSAYPPFVHAPSPNVHSGPDLSESDQEGSDVDGAEDLEPDINERSDDEDDRAAHEFLRAVPTAIQDPINDPSAVLPYNHQGFAEFGADNSVLQAHYARNRTPKAPTPSRLRRTQSANPAPQRPQERPVNKAHTVSSYPLQWQEVIVYAKQTFRAYVAGKNGFPDTVDCLKEARESLEDALAIHHEKGGTVETGYKIDKDMMMVVYSEAYLFRSQLKTDIRTQVRNLKSLFPDTFTGTAQELQSQIRDTIRLWVNDGSYLHDTVPGSDNQVHFAHPIISSTAKSFYFDRWRAISVHDRDTFQGSVPKPLIALIGTVFRNTLDEWADGHPSTAKMEQKAYKPVYDEILRTMAIVENDPIDGPCFQERLAMRAGFGRSMSTQTNASSRIPTTISLKLSSR